MYEGSDGALRCRKSRLLSLLLLLGLIGCMEQPISQPQPASTAAAACTEEARRLGFNVIDVGTPTQGLDGTEDVQILVQWSDGGAVHIRCRYDHTYGITLG